MPEISIVLPTYNGEQYIKEAINSILEQSFVDWELIVVNDSSTDNTPQILREYEAKDRRIKVIHNIENKKLPKSLNIGFSHAIGNFLTWTSDDNIYHPNALDKMHKYLLDNPAIYMVSGKMENIDKDGKRLDLNTQYDESTMMDHNSVGACFLYRKEVLKEVGDYDVDMFLVEDYDYWLSVLETYGTIGCIREPLYEYRRHDNTLTVQRKEDIKKQLLKLKKKHLDWILSCKKTDKKFIYNLYYDLLKLDQDNTQVKEIFYKYSPELKIDTGNFDEKKKVIIFGAGHYGEMAARLLEEKVEFFADSNEIKVGTCKLDKQIISVKEMANKACDYNIVVAVCIEKIHELLYVLQQYGVESCCTYQKYICNINL